MTKTKSVLVVMFMGRQCTQCTSGWIVLAGTSTTTTSPQEGVSLSHCASFVVGVSCVYTSSLCVPSTRSHVPWAHNALCKLGTHTHTRAGVVYSLPGLVCSRLMLKHNHHHHHHRHHKRDYLCLVIQQTYTLLEVL